MGNGEEKHLVPTLMRISYRTSKEYPQGLPEPRLGALAK
jgi:hypothetical protein